MRRKGGDYSVPRLKEEKALRVAAEQFNEADKGCRDKGCKMRGNNPENPSAPGNSQKSPHPIVFLPFKVNVIFRKSKLIFPNLTRLRQLHRPALNSRSHLFSSRVGTERLQKPASPGTLPTPSKSRSHPSPQGWERKGCRNQPRLERSQHTILYMQNRPDAEIILPRRGIQMIIYSENPRIPVDGGYISDR